MKKLPVLAVFSAFTLLVFGDEPTSVLETPETGIFGEMSDTGESYKKWHRMTFAFEGPQSSEQATPNPFLDYRLDMTFTHSATGKTLKVPGYYAADGRAGETSADSGNIWRAHFVPSENGEWKWKAEFRSGKGIAVDEMEGTGMPAFLDGGAEGIADGKFQVGPSDKKGRDNRSRGMLGYVGERYLKWAETGEYFLKQGADAPENLFAYADFDGDFKKDGQKDKLVKNYKPHLKDWKEGDPTWKNGKGKGLIGAINYLASEEMNVISFLTMNIDGDDRNVFMYTDYDERLRIDVSRMDQWEVVMNHADNLGFYLHFKTQEAENDTLLDGGELGPERKLYYRELIARFGHHLALNWNLGEENNRQNDAQRKAMAKYFHDHDPYQHNVVIHTYPKQKAKIHDPLLGKRSELTGLSLQGSHPKFEDVHGDVLTWVRKSREAGKPWVVAYDEPGNATQGLANDEENKKKPSQNGNYTDARHKALWGVLLAGGVGTEWYFGYKFAHSDLTLQDFRSRDEWWDYCRYALSFFRENEIPFHEMENNNELIGNVNGRSEGGYCFAKSGDVYVIYLPKGVERDVLLEDGNSKYRVQWFNPRSGGKLLDGSIKEMHGGIASSMGIPPKDGDKDWVVLVRKK
ncbi:MAG: DUF5060 domain-containing protein [Akkermansiaceae bacterium]